MEIWVTSNVKPESILVGECYDAKERKRTHYLAAIIVGALNEDDKNSDDASMEAFETELKKNDWGHQPC